MPSHMKAAVIRQFGTAAVLQLEQVPCPVAGQDEVLVRVHAAGINPIDFKTRMGTGVNRGWKDIRFPLILGWDISGVVVESRSPRFRPGDPVFSLARFPAIGGAYAEYAAIPAADLALKPQSLDHIHAAATPLAALTAWQALFDNAGLSSGQTVLIHAAAGGVGHLAVQLAKRAGATVIATASARNREFVLSLGADQFIDYSETRFEEHVRDVDVVFHTIGADYRPRSWSVLRKGGWLVTITGQMPDDEPAKFGSKGKFVTVKPSGMQLEKIAGIIDEGSLRISVEQIYPIADIARAHEHVEQGHTRGKVVVSLDA